jgi:putative aldouronate transport system substrate-binding protein
MVLVICIMFSFVAGCGSNTSSGTPSATTGSAVSPTAAATAGASANPSTTTVGKYGDTGGLKLPITTAAKCEVTWMTSHPDVEWNNTPFVQEIKKRTGIDLIVQNIPTDAYTEKVNTALAAKNLPNLLNVGVETANTYGEQGAFLALNKYYDKIPNFKKVIVDTPANSWYLKSYSTEAGNIYGWPILDLQRKVNHMYMYRKDIFDKNNLTVWKAGDTEGAYQVLKKLKTIYPNSYPVSSKMGNNFWWYQMAGWGLYSGVGSMSYNETDKTWYYPYTTKEFKQMADFFKKLYNEGILDPEFMTNTQNAWIAKMAEPEKTFVTFDWISEWTSSIYRSRIPIPNMICLLHLRWDRPVKPSRSAICHGMA